MSVYIYNSLTRKKEEFVPLNPPQVKIYACGLTVYDESHIGHARSLYIFNVIIRYLKYRGFQANFVRNITDIDDKIINRASELKMDWKDLAGKYIASYYKDLEALGIERADAEPKATENIKDMIKCIQALIKKGFAYQAGGDVYFNVREFPGYGKLSGQDPSQMRAGVRVEPKELKKDSLDFALWKSSKENEPSWDSPWGWGRPGWHIECSVMSQKFLKTKTLDIHAGGRDLIFPHHENEIAQAEALTGKPFAKYWVHHGLLTINGQKMAKSLGNFVTIKDFIAKYRDTDILKIFFLSAHYGSPVDFTDEKMLESKQALQRILILTDKIKDVALGAAKDVKEIAEIKNKFIEAMDDDFNTPRGLAAIFELVNAVNKNIDDLSFVASAKDLLFELKDIFGLSLGGKRRLLPDQSSASAANRGEITEKEIKTKIARRRKARQDKNYPLSDKLRKELEAKGVILEDTKDGKTTWRRKL